MTKISSYIHCGPWAEALAQRCADAPEIIMLTDQNIHDLYPEIFAGHRAIIVPQGDDAKTLEQYETTIEKLLLMGASRSTMLVGVGGGAICDLVGYVGSTFMRGCRFGFIATTILAQIDAAIGGKNGLNIGGYKNMVGTFRLPEFVIIDPTFHSTLPQREVLSARGEVLKYALLEGKDSQRHTLLSDPNYIGRCIAIKDRIVTSDPLETAGGARILLNLGHTFGHAIEKCSTGKISHGEAVAIGICIVAKISHKLGMLEKEELQEILQLAEFQGFNTILPAEITKGKILEALKTDKKHDQNEINLVLLQGIGRPTTHRILTNTLVDLYDQ